MSDCGVCLYVNEDDSEGSIDQVQVAILDRDQACCECEAIILAGSSIEQADWYDDGWNYDEDRETTQEERKTPIFTCLVCAEIATAFYCDGRSYGYGLWNSMWEVFGELNVSCFERLRTPEAKIELQRQWMKWKGLRG